MIVELKLIYFVYIPVVRSFGVHSSGVLGVVVPVNVSIDNYRIVLLVIIDSFISIANKVINA